MDVIGKLSGLKVFGDWGRADLIDDEGDTRTAVGAVLATLSERRTYKFTGQWTEHPKYGFRLEISSAQLTVALDRPFLESELQRLFSGCGTKTATRLVAAFEAEHAKAGGAANSWMRAMLEAIDGRPWEFETSSSKLRYIEPLNVPPGTRFLKSLQARVGRLLPQPVITKLHATLLDDETGDGHGSEMSLIAKLKEDPYGPCLSIDGYTFEIADAIASGLGLRRDNPMRHAFIAYGVVRDQSQRLGHAYLTNDQFVKGVGRLDPTLNAKTCLSEALMRELPIRADDIGIYLKTALEAEQTVAKAFAQMCGTADPLWTGSAEDLSKAIDQAQSAMGIVLDPSQRQAVMGLMCSQRRLHTLTAGPGCGKTMVMETVAAILGPQANFAAPTGKAAKVLSRRVGSYGTVATTVHALLGANGESFALDAQTPLQGSLIVVDEAGMQDLAVCAALVEAIPQRMHLLLVGDLDQLDSVGAGRVLADAVQLEQADHHRLSTPHRSGQEILRFLQGVREGQITGASDDGSVVLHEPNPDAGKCFSDLSQEWLDSVAANGLESVALLFGHRKGDPSTPGLNVTFANAALQDLINVGTSENSVPGTSLRIEDRILIRRNLTLRHRAEGGRMETYAQLVNGDSGYLVGYSAEGGSLEALHLRMDDGREVALPAAFASRVELGYAQTVHSAQGSEFGTVILFLSGRGGDFLNRRLLYTGASRARDRLILVAPKADLASIAAYQSAPRQSGLVKRTRLALGLQEGGEASQKPAVAKPNAAERPHVAPATAQPAPQPAPAPVAAQTDTVAAPAAAASAAPSLAASTSDGPGPVAEREEFLEAPDDDGPPQAASAPQSTKHPQPTNPAPITRVPERQSVKPPW
jgi:exodeoxyribonuclease V alpha subunit